MFSSMKFWHLCSDSIRPFPLHIRQRACFFPAQQSRQRPLLLHFGQGPVCPFILGVRPLPWQNAHRPVPPHVRQFSSVFPRPWQAGHSSETAVAKARVSNSAFRWASASVLPCCNSIAPPIHITFFCNNRFGSGGSIFHSFSSFDKLAAERSVFRSSKIPAMFFNSGVTFFCLLVDGAATPVDPKPEDCPLVPASRVVSFSLRDGIRWESSGLPMLTSSLGSESF